MARVINISLPGATVSRPRLLVSSTTQRNVGLTATRKSSSACRAEENSVQSRTKSCDQTRHTSDHPTWHKRTGAALLSALMLLGSPNNATANTFSIDGVATVVDGDTLVVNNQKIRLYGVDAPEKAQVCSDTLGQPYACGLVSRDALTAKLGSQSITCDVKQQDQYGRNVASCQTKGALFGVGSEDVGTWLVSNGYAVAYRQYSKDYIPVEEAARTAHTGVWKGQFQIPADWRRQQKGFAPVAAAATVATVTAAPQFPAPTLVVATGSAGQGCPNPLIKGNISQNGEKIYHVPLGKLYDRVKIDTAAGERYFCTEQEAVAAGWRAAKG